MSFAGNTDDMWWTSSDLVLLDIYISDAWLFRCSKSVNLARVTDSWELDLCLSPIPTSEAVPGYSVIRRTNSTLAALHCPSFLDLCRARLDFFFFTSPLPEGLSGPSPPTRTTNLSF